MPILYTLLIALWLISPVQAEETTEAQLTPEAQLANALPLLLERSFDIKAQAVDQITQSNDPRAKTILEAMLNGDLYYRKSDDKIVFLKEKDGEDHITDVLTNEYLGTVGGREAGKIGINNRLRGQLRTAIAGLSLGNPDPKVRLDAVNQMLDNIDPEQVSIIQSYYQKEQNSKVKEVMEVALALSQLKQDDPQQQLQALEELQGHLHPSVRNRLNQLVDEATTDSAVQQQAASALKQIETKIYWYGWIETLFFGISAGSVLVLAAIGLAITFGVMGVINMAHGELIMLGAYTTYVVQQLLPNHIEISLFIAIPAAFLVSAIVGIMIQQGVIRFLKGRPLETLLATFGVSLILQQAVRSIFSPLNRSVETPLWMSGSVEINSVLSLTLNRLYIIAFCLLVFSVLFFILKQTNLGLQVRAVSQNRPMARAMGIRSEWVDAMTFGLGAGIAGVAGVALSQLTNVGPNLGQAYIIDSFMVVVFGGVGNLWGTLVGGLSLGVANKLLEPWAGAVLAKILVLVFIILFIQKRPRGLFPQKGRAVES
jgi:urea transport system permease protein